MSGSDIEVLIGVPAVWLIGYFLYSPETRAMPATRFWLRLTFAMVILAVGATILKVVIGDGDNDQAQKALQIVTIAALLPIAFWLIVATVRSK
jgi:biotin transporter BioY